MLHAEKEGERPGIRKLYEQGIHMKGSPVSPLCACHIETLGGPADEAIGAGQNLIVGYRIYLCTQVEWFGRKIKRRCMVSRLKNVCAFQVKLCMCCVDLNSCTYTVTHPKCNLDSYTSPKQERPSSCNR